MNVYNTESISFICAFGYRVLNFIPHANREYDKFCLLNENKGYSKPFWLHRRNFLQFVNKNHAEIKKSLKKPMLDATRDFDLFHFGMLYNT